MLVINTKEVEAGGSIVLLYPQLHRKSKVSLGYIEVCRKKERRERKEKDKERRGEEGRNYFQNGLQQYTQFRKERK